MPVSARNSSRTSLRTSVPVLIPLYSPGCNSLQFEQDGEFLVGSETGASLSLQIPGIAPRHALIRRQHGNLSVVRLSGRVWINDLPISGECSLNAGDQVSFGPAGFEISTVATEPQAAATVSSTGPAQTAFHAAHALPSPPAPQAEVTAENVSAQEVRQPLHLRELQIQELSRILQERESGFIERLQSLNERATFLQDQKLELDRYFSGRTEELRLRDEQLKAQELELAGLARKLHENQLQVSEIAEAQSQRELALQQQATELQRQREVFRLSEQDQLATANQLAQRQEILNAQQAGLRAQESRLAERDSELQQLSLQLRLDHESIAAQLSALELQAADLQQRQKSLEIREAELVQAKAAEPPKPAHAETRSVGQLAAIAAERENTLKARQEAADLQSRLQSAQSELQKVMRDLQVSEEARWQLQADLQSAQQEPFGAQQSVVDREATLNAREARLDELQAAAAALTHAAEAEREALERSHKDLLCERNSLVQRSQDLTRREAGLLEREQVVAAQTEELRFRYETLTQQSQVLAQRESELDARGAELHRKLSALQAESTALNSAEPHQLPTDMVPQSELESLESRLQASKTEKEALRAERDALLNALRELQKTLENVRTDAEEASRIRGEASRQEQLIGQLYQTIEERSAQLQISESRAFNALQELDTLRAQLSDASEAVQIVEPATADSSESRVADIGCEETEEQLLSQIETLREELAAASGSGKQRDSEFERQLEQRDLQIDQLTARIEQLQQLLADAEARPVAADHGEIVSLKARAEQADQDLKERNDLIRELQDRLSRLSDSDSSGPVPDRESLLNEARELDRRANLLDHRDEELRERARKVHQSEEEVETQRRQLLDARQQLEIARAEIQVAMKQHSQPQPPPVPESPSPAAPGDIHLTKFLGSGIQTDFVAPEEPAPEPSTNVAADVANDLRSELASLFGLRKPAPDPVPQARTEFIDLSEAAGESKGVTLKFGDDASILIEAAPQNTPVEEPQREENSDDFVRDYMEQLLARSRKAAGNTLPDELKSGTKKNSEPAAPAAASAKKKDPPGSTSKAGPKVKSFIEEYMSGGFGDLTGEGAPARRGTSATEQEESQADEPEMPRTPPRPKVKIDVQKMRENMDSLRTLSTQSVENALVTHAMRKERSAITGRVMLVVALFCVAIFMLVAYVMGIFDQPLVICGSLVGAIVAGAELAHKYYSLKVRTKAALAPDDSLTHRTSPPSSATGVPAPVAAAPDHNTTPADVDPIDVADELPHRDRSDRFTIHPADEEERSRYFEL